MPMFSLIDKFNDKSHSTTLLASQYMYVLTGVDDNLIGLQIWNTTN